MATKRIQDLENVEEVLEDSIIPVGEAIKTKSMLVSQLKNWLSNFFVKKTGDESIYGYKSFEDTIYRRVKGLDVNTIPSSNKYLAWISPRDENNVNIGFFGTIQRTNGSLLSRLGVTKYIDGTGIYQELTVEIDIEGSESAY